MRNAILALLPVVLCIILLTVHAVLLIGEYRKNNRERKERERKSMEGDPRA
jgi:hypothetical protein